MQPVGRPGPGGDGATGVGKCGVAEGGVRGALKEKEVEAVAGLVEGVGELDSLLNAHGDVDAARRKAAALRRLCAVLKVPRRCQYTGPVAVTCAVLKVPPAALAAVLL